MSVLLVDPPDLLGSLIVKRLVAQGDEVRVVGPEEEAQQWRELGAYAASGRPDPDLIERAGQNVRTMVLFDPMDDVSEVALEAAEAARIGRVIVITPGSAEHWPQQLTSAGFDYVVLRTGRKRLFRRVVPDDRVAIAVDAADDLAGRVGLDLDLAEPTAWAALGIESPF